MAKISSIITGPLQLQIPLVLALKETENRPIEYIPPPHIDRDVVKSKEYPKGKKMSLPPTQFLFEAFPLSLHFQPLEMDRASNHESYHSEHNRRSFPGVS